MGIIPGTTTQELTMEMNESDTYEIKETMCPNPCWSCMNEFRLSFSWMATSFCYHLSGLCDCTSCRSGASLFMQCFGWMAKSVCCFVEPDRLIPVIQYCNQDLDLLRCLTVKNKRFQFVMDGYVGGEPKVMIFSLAQEPRPCESGYIAKIAEAKQAAGAQNTIMLLYCNEPNDINIPGLKAVYGVDEIFPLKLESNE